jgi:hypothetical protein
MVHAAEIGQKAPCSPTPVRDGVEKTNLDIGMCVERRNAKINLFRLIVVIKQQAYAHASLSGTHQSFGHDPASGVDFPDVVLRIQGFFRQVRHGKAGQERATSLPHEGETRLTRVPVRRLLKERADTGRLRFGEGRRGHARVVPVDRGPACAQQEN